MVIAPCCMRESIHGAQTPSNSWMCILKVLECYMESAWVGVRSTISDLENVGTGADSPSTSTVCEAVTGNDCSY